MCIDVLYVLVNSGVTAFLHQYYKESDLQSFYSEYFPELSGVPIAGSPAASCVTMSATILMHWQCLQR